MSAGRSLQFTPVAVTVAVASPGSELVAAPTNTGRLRVESCMVDTAVGSFRVVLTEGSGGRIVHTVTVSLASGPHVHDTDMCRGLKPNTALYYYVDNVVGGPAVGEIIVGWEAG